MADAIPPLGDLPLLNWNSVFGPVITAAPTVYGLIAADATAFNALKTDYATKLATATNPATRTRGTISAKNLSKSAVRAKAQLLIRIISAVPTVTDEQRIDLGLRPRDVIPTPSPVPSTKPLIILQSNGVITLHDELTPSRRGKPAGVTGALIQTHLAPPTSVTPVTFEDARFAALVTRSRYALPLPEDANAKTLYVYAQWFNPRGELGPVSTVAVKTIAA